MGCYTYTVAFKLAKEDVKENVAYGYLRIESRYEIQKAFDMMETKVDEINEERENADDDEGPKNSFEALEATNAMDNLPRINLVEDEQPDVDFQSMIAKLDVDQKGVFDIIIKKTGHTDNNADVLRCLVCGTGGTGKGFLVKTLKVWVQMKKWRLVLRQE
ncbi:hypothetical protein JTB14_004561 [Gonioctena quinquepunctata]|nr:hypothetical protein JTB14_004561 [Gonioctena quinquepunctata]